MTRAPHCPLSGKKPTRKRTKNRDKAKTNLCKSVEERVSHHGGHHYDGRSDRHCARKQVVSWSFFFKRDAFLIVIRCHQPSQPIIHHASEGGGSAVAGGAWQHCFSARWRCCQCCWQCVSCRGAPAKTHGERVVLRKSTTPHCCPSVKKKFESRSLIPLVTTSPANRACLLPCTLATPPSCIPATRDKWQSMACDVRGGAPAVRAACTHPHDGTRQVVDHREPVDPQTAQILSPISCPHSATRWGELSAHLLTLSAMPLQFTTVEACTAR